MARTSFTRLQLLRIASISPARLRQWQDAGLLPRRAQYTWQDLVAVRKLKQLTQTRIPLDVIHQSLRSAHRLFPEVENPLAELGLEVVHGRIEARYGGVRMDTVSGQMRIDFPCIEPIALPAATTAPPVDAAGASQWFSEGLRLEALPERREDAIAAYRQCLKLDATHTSAWINLGTLCYHQKRLTEAESCYRKALALHPHYALACFDLANVLDETGRQNEAIEAYRQALRLSPDYADAHYNLALAYQRTGQHRRAIPHWRRYLKLDATSPWAAHARAQLKRALAQDVLRVVGATAEVSSSGLSPAGSMGARVPRAGQQQQTTGGEQRPTPEQR